MGVSEVWALGKATAELEGHQNSATLRDGTKLWQSVGVYLFWLLVWLQEQFFLTKRKNVICL